MRYAPVLAFGLLAAPLAAEERVLTVFAPDYFGSEWGPGPAIETAFEQSCGCDLRYRTGDLLSRLLIEGTRTEAGVAIGFNSDVRKRARESGLFAPHGQDTSDLTMPIDWQDEIFLPFNWGHTAFVYDSTRLDEPPASFQALLDAPDDAYAIAIQDPRTSISGLALLLWVKEIYGDDAQAAWERLAPKVVTVTRGWSESYGLFTEGEVDMVLSYTTSPAYHLIAEDDDTKKAATFPEGHYFMVELAARLASTDQPDLADAFMAFVLSEEFQSLIPEANWSIPARLAPEKLPEGFKALAMPEKVILLDEDEADRTRDEALSEWLAAFGAG